MSRNRAFTLIELLVVIAIIAILAAILFPVFAQAKAAAKKTKDLAQFKQVGTSITIYTADYDDVLPLSLAADHTGWVPGNTLIDTPADWDNTIPAQWVAQNQVFWQNASAPYIKNLEITKSSAGVDYSLSAPYGAPGTKPYATNNILYNGTLNAFSSTGINSPSQLIMFSQSLGTMNIRGYSLSNPQLYCMNVGPCVFMPSSPTCDGFSTNGAWSDLNYQNTHSQWVHGRGQITVQADSSARWRSMNSGINQPSDFRSMYWSRFNAQGKTITEWQDTNVCHSLLFQPDFDFANFGTPVEY